MIAISHNLPFVNWNHQNKIPLTLQWITESIHHSAQRAGVPEWHLSEEIAKGIVYFLKSHYQKNTISTDKLTDIIKRSLIGIGYPEIARHTHVSPPRINIYLPDIAKNAPYELVFFALLKQSLLQATETTIQGVRLEGLKPCVKMINKKRRWRTTCQSLGEEIVAFTRKNLTKNQLHPAELIIC